jgi:signal transduction histidine kinase
VEFYWLPPFLAGILDFFLALLVIQRGPRRALNQVFCSFALSLTAWNLDIAALYFFTDYNLAFQWSEYFRYGMLFIPSTVFHLALVLTGRLTLANRLLLAIAYEISLVLCLAASRGMLIQRLETFTWGFYPIGTPLYKLHTFADLFYFSLTLYHLIRGFIASPSARQRQQLKLTLLGFAIALPIGLTNLLPVYGISIYPLGNLGNVFLCATLTYAIVKHGLLDVNLIITKTVASVLALVLWLAPLWMLTAEVQRRLYGATDSRLLAFAFVVFVLSALIFPWLLRVSEKVVRRLLWGQKFDSLQALSAFQHTMIQVLDQKKILSDLRQVLGDTLQTEFVTVYLCQPATQIYVDPQGEAPPLILEDNVAAALMKRQEPLVREEVLLEEDDAEASVLATVMTERGAEICAALSAQERLIGLLLLGRKRNRDAFSTEDLHLLATLGAEVAVALENARLYEELKNSQIMLARTDRLAAVGTLAAGIAHEIRNPLVAVQTFVQLLPEQIDDPEFRTTFLELTNSELSRVSTLINDLMTFARPSPATLDEAQVNDVAEQIVRLLTGQAKKRDVTLTARLAPDLSPFVVDQGQIKQVFMNLVMNALQATPAGGSVTIATSLTREADGQAWCVIEVRDTGAGIPPEQKEQIFDPFFTTKETGVGLGLFITHQIIKEHGGTIQVESEVGQGTQFLIRLPIKRLFAEPEVSATLSSFQAEMDTLVL